jgi:hypothetical protein
MDMAGMRDDADIPLDRKIIKSGRGDDLTLSWYSAHRTIDHSYLSFCYRKKYKKSGSLYIAGMFF